MVSWVVYAEPIGKGGALIEGLKLAPRADLVGYVDADGATEPPAFLDLARRAGEADCVIGSRWLPGAVLHQVQSGRRRFASRCFHLIVDALFGMNIRDTQCGAKIIHRTAVEKVHSSLCIADMAFDINLLYLLKRNGLHHSGSADGMDGQIGVESGPVPHLPDDAFVGHPGAVDLFAVQNFAPVFCSGWRTGFTGSCGRRLRNPIRND